MIKLFDKSSLNFSTLGVGVLSDCLYCEVSEELNGSYELEMEYPITGLHYNDLELDKIIVCPPDRYKNDQPFRIYSISRPLNGKVKVKAAHITYDMNNYPIRTFVSNGLNNTLVSIRQNSVIQFPFIFNAPEPSIQGSFSCEKVRSLRSLFYDNGSKDISSIIGTYDTELDIDGFNINILPKNGIGGDNGVHIRYGKNLTSLTQDTNSEKDYTGIFPVYVSNQREQREFTNEEKEYEKIYTRAGVTPFTEEWLGWKENSVIPAIIADDGKRHPLQIMSEGPYYQHIVIWDDDPNNPGKCKYFDVTNQQDQYPPTQTKFAIGYEESYVTITLYKEEGGVVTDNGVVYVNGRESDAFQKILIVDFSQAFDNDEQPTESSLRAKAEEYITENKIGETEISVKASFIFLSDTSEYADFFEAERIALGDTITVIYEALGVSDKLRIKKITYDAVSDKYKSVELGDRLPYLAGVIVRTNDNISVLSNNSRFVNDTQLTGNIESGANNSWLSDNQKQEIQNTFFNCPGIIQASSDTLDQIVAKLLIVDNAYVKNMLMAGEVIVNGTITAQDGVFYGTVSVGGDKQSRIDSLYAENLSSSNINSGFVNSNTAKTGKLTLAGYQGVLQTITVNDYTYYRDESLDESGYYGWTSIEHVTPEVYNQLLTTVTVPFVGSSTYYKDTKSFYDLVDDYNPYGYTLYTNTDLVVESLAGGAPITVTFSAGVTATRNTSGKTIDCIATVTASNQVPENTYVRVMFSVACVDDTGTVVNTYNEIAICTLQAAGAVASDATIKIPNPNNTMYPLTPTITLVTPTSKEYTVEDSGTSMVSINNNFGPKESNKYSLGRGSRLWSDVYAANSTIQTSDERTKKDISYDVSKYDQLFDKLKPVSFKFKEGESGRTHLGLIAQDVKQAMDECDISTQDFAGYVKYLGDESIKEPVEEDYLYAIRYGEFISLCIHKIQQLEARVKELENKEGS